MFNKTVDATVLEKLPLAASLSATSVLMLR